MVFCATAIVIRCSLAQTKAYIYIWLWMMLRYMFGYTRWICFRCHNKILGNKRLFGYYWSLSFQSWLHTLLIMLVLRWTQILFLCLEIFSILSIQNHGLIIMEKYSTYHHQLIHRKYYLCITTTFLRIKDNSCKLCLEIFQIQ